MEQHEMLAKVYDMLDEILKPECPQCHLPTRYKYELCPACTEDLQEAQARTADWPDVQE